MAWIGEHFHTFNLALVLSAHFLWQSVAATVSNKKRIFDIIFLTNKNKIDNSRRGSFWRLYYSLNSDIYPGITIFYCISRDGSHKTWDFWRLKPSVKFDIEFHSAFFLSSSENGEKSLRFKLHETRCIEKKASPLMASSVMFCLQINFYTESPRSMFMVAFYSELFSELVPFRWCPGTPFVNGVWNGI